MRNAIRSFYYYRGGQGYSAELTAVLAKATTEGYTAPGSAALSAWDTFLRARQADGSLVKIDLLYNAAWNNVNVSDFSRIDQITATRTASFVNAITYRAGGWKGDAVSAYVDTEFNPATQGTNYIQNSASRGIWVKTEPVTGTAYEGTPNTAQNCMFYNAASIGQKINQGGTNLDVPINTTGTGYKAMNRTSSTNVQAYNELVRTDCISTSQALLSENQSVIRVSTGYSDVEVAMYYMGGSLTETQHNNIRNDYATFLTAIGL